MGAVYFNSCLLFLSINYVRKTTEWTRHSLCFLLPLGILKCPELTISTWATAGIWASPVAEDSSIVCYVLVWEHWHTIWLRRKTGSVRVELLMVLKSRIKPKSGHCSRLVLVHDAWYHATRAVSHPDSGMGATDSRSVLSSPCSQHFISNASRALSSPDPCPTTLCGTSDGGEKLLSSNYEEIFQELLLLQNYKDQILTKSHSVGQEPNPWFCPSMCLHPGGLSTVSQPQALQMQSLTREPVGERWVSSALFQGLDHTSWRCDSTEMLSLRIELIAPWLHTSRSGRWAVASGVFSEACLWRQAMGRRSADGSCLCSQNKHFTSTPWKPVEIGDAAAFVVVLEGLKTDCQQRQAMVLSTWIYTPSSVIYYFLATV